ncbi:GIN domain-containing protein, partial [Lactococcus lactis]|uniref:GIN domain-containing protein n=2 Tax=Bacteria TaxID=2 RepID=UPI003D1021CD
GAWIVILVAAAAIAFSFEHRRALSRPVDSLLNSRGSKANDPVQPSSYRNRKVAVQGFDSLKVSGPFKVAILASAEASRVQLVGPSALLADTIVEVEDNTLVIRFRE